MSKNTKDLTTVSRTTNLQTHTPLNFPDSRITVTILCTRDDDLTPRDLQKQIKDELLKRLPAIPRQDQPALSSLESGEAEREVHADGQVYTVTVAILNFRCAARRLPLTLARELVKVLVL